MITIDRSAGKPWRSQRDNTWRPHGSCNVTSYRMAADQAGIECPGDENDFLAFMNKPHWYHEIVARFPWAWEQPHPNGEFTYLYPPEQIHDLLAEGFNAWTVTTSARFDMCMSRAELMREILRGSGVVLSGKFPYRGGRSINHVVSLAGFETKQTDVEEAVVDPWRVTHWIIDDPYGDHRTEYDRRDGNGVKMSPADFAGMLKGNGPDCKWAHILTGGDHDRQKVDSGQVAIGD